jgi:DNA-binding transcriptional LysR family regulator
VRLLPEWSFGEAPVIALVPARSGITARTRALVQHLQEKLRKAPWLAKA